MWSILSKCQWVNRTSFIRPVCLFSRCCGIGVGHGDMWDPSEWASDGSRSIGFCSYPTPKLQVLVPIGDMAGITSRHDWRLGHGWRLSFYDCIVNNDRATLKMLIKKHKIDLNAEFTEPRNKKDLDLSPIHLAACEGHVDMLQYLYGMRTNIHQTTATTGCTSLHFAVLNHKVACVHKLLTLGCNPDICDKVGNSACHYAAEDGTIDILDALLKHDVDTNAQDMTLKTPLMKASRNDRLDAVKRLVNAGCVVNMHDENCDTALHFAARRGSAALVQVLLTAGSQVDILNQWGHTPLMDAICYNNKDAATLILAAGCDVNLRASKSGDTVVHMAVRKNYCIFFQKVAGHGQNASYIQLPGRTSDL